LFSRNPSNQTLLNPYQACDFVGESVEKQQRERKLRKRSEKLNTDLDVREL